MNDCKHELIIGHDHSGFGHCASCGEDEQVINFEVERLLRLAERENGCSVSVGGLMVMANKILFLDIDGVLNSAFVLDEQRRGDAIDRGMVERINQIVDATGCKIVISSTWRIIHPLDKLSTLLRQYGMRDVIIDKTPRLNAKYFNRGDEILMWLGDHPEVTGFIAIDDSAGEFDKITDHLVATTWKYGMQDEHVIKAIDILSKEQDVH